MAEKTAPEAATATDSVAIAAERPLSDDPRAVEMVRQLDEDVGLMVRLIGHAAERAQAKVDENQAAVARIRAASRLATSASAKATEVAADLATTTGRLLESAKEIAETGATADGIARDARGVAADVDEGMRALVRAVGDMAEASRLIA
ncbi:MAG: hypothetical protein KGQ28_03160, partial [Hyphomicrobiales bacterium]|nr:hypothetical protein [Hyphomicrobiales bacterium]